MQTQYKHNANTIQTQCKTQCQHNANTMQTQRKTQKVRRFISPSDCFRRERKILSEHGRRLDEGTQIFLIDH